LSAARYQDHNAAAGLEPGGDSQQISQEISLTQEDCGHMVFEE
jgi:hypothetical protein